MQDKEGFLQNILQLKEKKNEIFFHPLLKNFKHKAFERFLSLGLPDSSSEAFKYVPLHKLYQHPWKVSNLQPHLEEKEILSHVLPECQNSYLVFVNGILRLDLSNLKDLPRSVVIKSLSDATQNFGSYLNSRFELELKHEDHPFCLLNASLCSGAWILIPKGVECKTPLQCLEMQITSSDKGGLFFPRLQLMVSKEANAHLILTSSLPSGEEEPYFSSLAVEAVLEEGAHLNLFLNKQQAKKACVLDSFRFFLKKKASLNIKALFQGGAVEQSHLKVMLQEEESKMEFQSLSLLQEGKESHLHVSAHHLSENTQSMQLVKNLVRDHSKTSFEGKIYVSPVAQKTKAYQLNHNLLLSELSKASSKPNLQIFADDVKASHGATTSTLDEKQLFYLQTRGLDELLAKSLLMEGFCQEITENFSLDSLRLEAKQKIMQMSESLYDKADAAV